MLIDHAAYVLLVAWARSRHAWGAGVESFAFYRAMRIIGRLAFPIFCFLLAEGFRHTRSRAKYLLRLLLFALVSEIPFDLAFNGAPWKLSLRPTVLPLEFTSQNVGFTLLLGLAAVWLWDALLPEGKKPTALRVFGAVLGAGLCACAAFWLHTDYDAMGVVLIVVMDRLRRKPWLRDLAAFGTLAAMIPFGSSWIELLAAFGFPLLHLYNGKRGRQWRWFFYVFYPGHLLLLALLRLRLFGN
ncbi:MAG: conjugal transfer protein TraX [Oscillospiraceae bacterium]|nr:conjugal transfer protein TraX [Oscillospiraceae bacterium]